MQKYCTYGFNLFLKIIHIHVHLIHVIFLIMQQIIIHAFIYKRKINRTFHFALMDG